MKPSTTDKRLKLIPNLLLTVANTKLYELLTTVNVMVDFFLIQATSLSLVRIRNGTAHSLDCCNCYGVVFRRVAVSPGCRALHFPDCSGHNVILKEPTNYEPAFNFERLSVPNERCNQYKFGSSICSKRCAISRFIPGRFRRTRKSWRTMQELLGTFIETAPLNLP